MGMMVGARVDGRRQPSKVEQLRLQVPHNPRIRLSGWGVFSVRVFTALILVAVFLAAAPATAQQPSFTGKTVTIVVGFTPGGGYDQIARLMARYLPKYLPGSPTVVVQNMPGAASIIAANHVYNVAKPDGLTLGLFNRNLVLGQLVKVDGIRFDMNRFGWVGSMASETTVLAIHNSLPYREATELRKASPAVVVGATGPGANTYDFPLLLKALAGFQLRIISGYPASADIMLAVERREVDGRAGSYSSLKSFIDRGLVRPIVRARATVPATARLPVDEDLVTEDRSKAVMRLRSTPEVIGRPFTLSPGTPPEILNVYREAFRRVSQDRDFLTDAERAGFEINFVAGDQVLRTVRTVLTAPSDVVKIFSQFFKFE
jgi:tripartite-type tricarboxylate transporter receptor subunit TctC